MLLETYADQLLGDREGQHDSYGFSSYCVFVADGMGARPEAREAADIAIATSLDLARDVVKDNAVPGWALATACGEVSKRLARASCPGGTTLAGFFLRDDGLLWIASIGDSRVVVLRGGHLEYLTRRHRQSDEDLAMNPPRDPVVGDSTRLTRFLRAGQDWALDIGVVRPFPGDTILAMTDGVEDVTGLDQVVQLSGAGSGSAEVVAAVLARVDELGPFDNATLAVATVVADESSKGGELP